MRTIRFLSLTFALLLGMLAIPVFTAHAQDDPLAGVTVEALGAVQPAVAPGETLQLLKLTLQPGTTIAMHHHPGPVIISVVSGQFTTSFAQSSATITRAGAATGATPEAVDPGESYVLNPGDAVSYDANTMGHIMSNAGSEPLVLIASVLFQDGQPGFIFEEATPTS